MKSLSVLLALMVIALPLQGRSCAMSDQNTSPAPAVANHDGHATGASGHHDSGASPARANPSSHDCCIVNEEALQSACNGGDHCLSCPVGTMALAVLPQVVAGQPISYDQAMADGQLPPAHAAPPYRPPGFHA